LEIFDKRHTMDDFIRVVSLFREVGLVLCPTFVTFTPWTSLEGYRDLLDLLAQLDLIENLPPIQLAIRLLIPAGSRLLELPAVQELVGAFDEAALCYRWTHPDPRVDQLYADVLAAVQAGQAAQKTRPSIFGTVWDLTHRALGVDIPALVMPSPKHPKAPIPYLSEAWFCCAEPTEEQAASI